MRILAQNELCDCNLKDKQQTEGFTEIDLYQVLRQVRLLVGGGARTAVCVVTLGHLLFFVALVPVKK
jgi:hypothetical protein